MKNEEIPHAYKREEYKYGFVTPIESDVLPKGINEDVVRAISAKRNDPDFMLDFRVNAYRQWTKMAEPHWSNLKYGPIDYQAVSYYSAPKPKKKLESLEEVPPEILRTFEKLGISLSEQKRLSNVAVDAVFDSVSVATTHQKKLKEHGIIFCSISEAIKEHPDLVRKYLGSVVPYTDNFFAALNSAVFSDGSFVYIPPDTKCPMELSTYFRINTEETGQFERTLIIADCNSHVSYIEGCTAPQFDTNQLHAAIVELVALDNAEIKYSTVQNWYAGDPETGKGGIFNFVVKRGKCLGRNSKISWTQIETGSAITWKYPGCVLIGDNSSGEFYSVALTNGYQQADTGSKMIHIGKNTKSVIISKGIAADHASNSYRGLVRVAGVAENARNYTQCDSMLVGDKCSAHTFPYIEADNSSAQLEHEASTSKISEEQLLYFQQRGISREEAIRTILNGFCKDVFKQLPLEFAVEAQKLLALKLEKSVG
ncbi:MAG: Fe-S cluster assembly protein SufB [Nitrospinae bacterium]|nr:Fe-S cluster assembly protein SufB [Nitrospinota bacterium]